VVADSGDAGLNAKMPFPRFVLMPWRYFLTGRYKILLNSGPRYFRCDCDRSKKCWSLFVGLCRSLARDGLSYGVELHLTDDVPHILVRAWGMAKHRQLKVVKPAIPPPPTQVQCAKRLDEAEKTLRSIRNQVCGTRRSSGPRWRYAYDGHWQETAERRKLLGHWLAKRLRVNPSSAVTMQDYRDLDQMIGHRVRRLSEISERYRPTSIKAFVLRELLHVNGNRVKWAEHQPSPFPFSEYQNALLDVEYWKELETLSGQRERFKPGRCDENAFADDEVAAVKERLSA
jgi:hypothetical protein